MELAKEVQLQMVTNGSRIEVIGTSIHGWWSRDAMKRALENIISNAFKYGTRHTPIRVKIEEVHEQLLLSVHNGGLPIPPEEQETIFQLFIRAHSAKAGSKSGWGAGCRMCVALPRATAAVSL